MSAFLQRMRVRLAGKQNGFQEMTAGSAGARNAQKAAAEPAEQSLAVPAQVEELDMAVDDPLLAYLVSTASAVEIDKLNLDSPTLRRLREAGVRVSVPLVSQGELIGLLNLGDRLSEQEYSTDDRRLLDTLAAQAAPAMRVAQLALQQQIQARERERMEQELRVARFIQQNLLPRELPQMAGWCIAAHWQPAREVSEDFYDFIELADGRLAFLVADVTDKGVPASLVMATTRSLLRASAERFASPAMVLERTNNLLYPDIPPKMFVTCLYGVLDRLTGEMTIANAGHNLPYQHTKDGFVERHATGMPLGLMEGMTYEEVSFRLEPGDTLLLTSDGLIEAHDPQNQMFGFERVKALVAASVDEDLIQTILQHFNAFTGPDHQQEDDLTLVSLTFDPDTSQEGKTVQEITFELPSMPGLERQAASRVLETVGELGLEPARLKRLETAVAEATMNAMEHGNGYNAELPAVITILRETHRLVVRISDQGQHEPIPTNITPDLAAKLSGEQSPRGWGLFLVRNMVDEMNTYNDQGKNTIELILHLDH